MKKQLDITKITKRPLNSIKLLAIDKNFPVSTIQSHNINILQGSKVVELLRKALKISKPRPMGRMVKLPGTNWVRPRRCWGGGLGIGQGLDTSVALCETEVIPIILIRPKHMNKLKAKCSNLKAKE